MIKVDTFESFIMLVNLAKKKNYDYEIFASEKLTVPNMSFGKKEEKDSFFRGTYYLACNVFSAYFTIKVKAELKETITNKSMQFGFIPVSRLSETNGIISFD